MGPVQGTEGYKFEYMIPCMPLNSPCGTVGVDLAPHGCTSGCKTNTRSHFVVETLTNPDNGHFILTATM